jgi:hypothetical protein
MGVVYTVLLFDDWDWKYKETSKEKKISEFIKDFPQATLEASWNKYLVFDFDKKYPLVKETGKRLLDLADVVFYYSELDPWNIKRLDAEDLV